MLSRRVAARQPPPTCLPELQRALLDEWCNISQDQIDNLILNMPRLFMDCIALAGRRTIHGQRVMNMNRYTKAEFADIHFIYGLANINGRVAVRLYGERYPSYYCQLFLPLNHQTEMNKSLY
ncbi:DDE_3 domain-containing protein [Trichonephila clavipes]|uniref:DDE_3 domain-containing protein n=1 Tax=Trichonephila clavipes TaxID=2585209 RepID=A0A8X6RDN5_TRICX|nr:DDE_3 domain-containing protein [Trichonephila clavipes]